MGDRAGSSPVIRIFIYPALSDFIRIFQKPYFKPLYVPTDTYHALSSAVTFCHILLQVGVKNGVKKTESLNPELFFILCDASQGLFRHFLPKIILQNCGQDAIIILFYADCRSRACPHPDVLKICGRCHGSFAHYNM